MCWPFIHYYSIAPADGHIFFMRCLELFTSAVLEYTPIGADTLRFMCMQRTNKGEFTGWLPASTGITRKPLGFFVFFVFNGI